MTVLQLTNFNIRDLELNPNVYVLYLENEKRKGGDRLSISLRDHHRSLSIVVKKSGGVDEESYYTNREFEWVRESLEKDFNTVFNILNNRHDVFIPMEIFTTNHWIENVANKVGSKIVQCLHHKWNDMLHKYSSKKIQSRQ